MTVDMEKPLTFYSSDPVLIHIDSISIEVCQGTLSGFRNNSPKEIAGLLEWE